MPHRLTAGRQVYELVYEPILSRGELVQALVVVSDITQRVEGERAVAEQKEFVDVVERFVKDRSGLTEFVTEADGTVRRLTSGKQSRLDVQRDIHTLRGDASMQGLTNIAECCRSIETRMHETGDMPAAFELAELAARWQRFFARLSALVGARATKTVEIDEVDYEAVLRAVQTGVPKAELVRMIKDLRFEPVEKNLARLAAQARVLGTRLGKGQVTVTINAARIRLDVDRWRPMWAALGHVVRNAVDHGLEAPEERRRLGKPENGCIALSAARHGTATEIQISDDGRGIDWEALAGRAASEGLQPKNREELLFVHGFSSRNEVTEYSGRGVGLGAVRAVCDAMGGTIEVHSTRGKGTAFRLIVPRAETAGAQAPEVHS
jgi:two-component system chemotaxis sensor kinase CheA